MVFNKFGPRISESPQPIPLYKLNILGTICPWTLNWLETVCPEGPINWGSIVGDQMCHSQFVADEICFGCT